MKRIPLLTLIMALAMAFALSGCTLLNDQKASEPESSAAEVTESTAEEEQGLEWTEVSSAKKAAKKAGVKEFIVPEAGTKISIGELDDYEYYYAEDLAEADTYAAAAAIVFRKGVGTGDNTKELSEFTSDWSDLETLTYDNKWKANIDGTKVTCYGNEEGKASKVIWNDGTYSYSILILGQGDTWMDFGLEADDIATLVKGTKKQEAKKEEKPAQEEAAQEEGDPRPEGDPGLDFNQLVFDNGLGQYEYTGEVFQGSDGHWYWPVYSRGADGALYASYFDVDGNLAWKDSEPVEGGDDSASDGPNLTTSDVENIVWEEGLGEFVNAQYDDNGGDGFWNVTVHDVNGDEVKVLIDDEDGSYVIP